MFSSLSRRRVITLVVLTCLLLITIDRNGNPVIDRVRGVVATVLRPLDTATDALVLPIERAWYGITNYDDLERENEALRDQLARQKGNDVEARSAVIEYRQLLNVLQLTSKFDYPKVAAQVIGDSPSNFQNTVEINVGANRGIERGMPVLDGSGLIGRVREVFPESSIVLLITDPDYSVKAQVLSTDDPSDTPTTTSPDGEEGEEGEQGAEPGTTTTSSTTTTTTTAPTTDPGTGDTVEPNTTTTSTTTTTTVAEVVRETGMLEGQGGGKPLLLRFTDSTSSVTNVRVGAIVDSAGGNSSLAPQGIPIGIITRVVRQSGDSSLLVEVTPNANLRELYFVTVLRFKTNDQALGR